MSAKSNAQLTADIISVITGQTTPESITPITHGALEKDIVDSFWNKVDDPNIVGIESGTFTLNAAGTVATGAVLTNPGASPILTITTTRELTLWFGIAVLNVSTAAFSNGKSDGVNHSLSTGAEAFLNACIKAQAGADGWSAIITTINPTSYVLAFTKAGAGADLTAQWHGVMQ